MRTRGGDGRRHAQEGVSEATSPAHSWVWESSLQAWRQQFPLLKVPGLWVSVSAARTNLYT